MLAWKNWFIAKLEKIKRERKHLIAFAQAFYSNCYEAAHRKDSEVEFVFILLIIRIPEEVRHFAVG